MLGMHTFYKQFQRLLGSLWFLAVIAAPVAVTGCADRSSYRVYAQDHHDYHQWNQNEVVFYTQWENDTHRDHNDFRKRSGDEQREYWTWRHNHGDQDRDNNKKKDRDHDHDHR